MCIFLSYQASSDDRNKIRFAWLFLGYVSKQTLPTAFNSTIPLEINTVLEKEIQNSVGN